MNKKGVSLPLVTGLVALLMVSSAALNELIIRTVQSVRRIEASNKAYMAAEAGLEDALYELTPHLAGYQTPPINQLPPGNGEEGRFANFESNDAQWYTNWEIASRSGKTDWTGCGDPLTCDAGPFTKDRKLNIYLHNDINFADQSADGVGDAAINTQTASIQVPTGLNIFDINFSLPKKSDGSNLVPGASTLKIDNDNDDLINEDRARLPSDTDPDGDGIIPGVTGLSDNGQVIEDADGDGLFDEDSAQEPFILWTLSDGKGHTLTPLPGCFGSGGTEICENNFTNANNYTFQLDHLDEGERENGGVQRIEDFFLEFMPNNTEIGFEFLIIAPMEHCVEAVGDCSSKVEIPYLDYAVRTNVTDVPLPAFVINSDGYYGTFKQSLSTTVVPRTTVPLFDFTIIQQE